LPTPRVTDRSRRAERPAWIAGLALFAVALGIRLIYLRQIGGSPAAGVLFGDGEAYDLWAKRIAAGDWLGGEAFYQAPLYPYALAVFYVVATPSLAAVRLAQAILGSATAVLVAIAGARVFDKRAGLAAGALYALYPIAIYADGLIQKTTLEAFLLALLLVIVSRLEGGDDSGAGAWTAAGITLGLLGLVRENALILAPLLVGRSIRPRGQRRWGNVAAVACGIAMVLVPVGVRNLVVGGSFQPTTFQLGTNLFIGNNEAATGVYAPLAEGGGSWKRERDDAVRLGEAAAGRHLSPREVSSYWSGRALAFVRDHPGAWLELMARKAALVGNRVEVGDHESPRLFADASPLLRALLAVWHFGVLLPAAALGMALTWSAGRRPLMLYAILGALAASVAIFYVFGRYRFSLVPVLVLFAGAGFVRLADAARGIKIPAKTAVTAALAAALIAIASNRSLVRSETIDANAYFNLGWKLEGEERGNGDQERARAAYERAVAIRPDYPDALNNLGNVLARQGKLDESKARFAAAVAADPRHANAQLNLGRVLLLQGDAEDALPHLEVAARLHPDDPTALDQLAKALFKLGRFDAAIPPYAGLARRYPTAANHNNLGSALAAAGKLEEAAGEFQQALRLDPSFVPARDNLALANAQLDGRHARSEVHPSRPGTLPRTMRPSSIVEGSPGRSADSGPSAKPRAAHWPRNSSNCALARQPSTSAWTARALYPPGRIRARR
jgi:tetratricopeptide (TPR) repeat protein